MRAVPSGRKRTNLFNFARIYFALEPFMPSVLYFGSASMAKKLESMHQTGMWYIEKKNIVGQLVPIQDAHFALKEAMEDDDMEKLFLSKTYVALPGVSIDQTVHERGIFPSHIGYDLASERNRLSTEILRIIESLYTQAQPQSSISETNFLPLYNQFLDQYRFLQMNDFIFPARVQMEFLPRGLHAVLDHTVDGLTDIVEDELIRLKKTLLGNTRKALDTYYFYPENADLFLLSEAAATQVINDFALTVVDSQKAHDIYAGKYMQLIEGCRHGKLPGPGALRRLKDLFGTKDESFPGVTIDDVHKKVTKVLTYDKWLMANAYATFFRLARPSRIVPYAKKTSYVEDILDRVSQIEPLPIEGMGEAGIMRNTDMSVLGECDHSALRILEGWLAYELEEFIYADSEAEVDFDSIYPSQRYFVEQFPETEVCDTLITCNALKSCDGNQRCAKAYLNNKFTRDDIKELLVGLGRPASPVDIERTFDDLVFTEEEQRLLAEDTEKNHYLLPGSIHQDLALLGSGKDFDIFLHNNENHYLVRSWIGMHGPDLKVEPLVVPDASKMPYQIRASEFGASCYLSRLLSKVDPDKLPEPIDNNLFSIVGTATHRLWNERPWLYYLERPDDSTAHVMDFCEKHLAFVLSRRQSGLDRDITILGSADGVAKVVSDAGEFIMILDRKRANYYKQAFNLQTMIYAQGVLQMVATRTLFEKFFAHEAVRQNHSADIFNKLTGYITCINNRPFVSVPDEPTRPQLVLGYAPVHAANTLRNPEIGPSGTKKMVKGLANIVANSYLAQRAIVSGNCSPFDYKGDMNKNGMCEFQLASGEHMDCLNKQKCDLVLDGLSEGRHWRDYFIDGVDI